MNDSPPNLTQTILDAVLSGHGMTLAEASRLLPRRGGKPVHPSTLHRWAFKGVSTPAGERVRLAVVKVGTSNCTTRPALLAFLAALQVDQSGAVNPPADPAPTAPLTERKASNRTARRQLRAAGI